MVGVVRESLVCDYCTGGAQSYRRSLLQPRVVSLIGFRGLVPAVNKVGKVSFDDTHVSARECYRQLEALSNDSRPDSGPIIESDKEVYDPSLSKGGRCESHRRDDPHNRFSTRHLNAKSLTPIPNSHIVTARLRRAFVDLTSGANYPRAKSHLES